MQGHFLSRDIEFIDNYFYFHWKSSLGTFLLFLYLFTLMIGCTDLRTKLFCCQVSGNQGVSRLHVSGCKMYTSGNAPFCHLYCTLTEHSDIPHNSKYRVTSSTPLHTGTKCLPRQLIVYAISHFRVGIFYSIKFCALVHPWHVLHIDTQCYNVLLNKLLSL
jgi:hypothetical protein